MADALDQFNYLSEIIGLEDRRETVSVQFRCSSELAEELREICRYNSMDQTQVVVIALRLYLEYWQRSLVGESEWKEMDEEVLEAAEDDESAAESDELPWNS